jgi:hypothetical protein
MPPAGREAKIAQTPLRRLGEPIEVAHGVLFWHRTKPVRHRAELGSMRIVH